MQLYISLDNVNFLGEGFRSFIISKLSYNPSTYRYLLETTSIFFIIILVCILMKILFFPSIHFPKRKKGTYSKVSHEFGLWVSFPEAILLYPTMTYSDHLIRGWCSLLGFCLNLKSKGNNNHSYSRAIQHYYFLLSY